jgi:hypothetical protein
MRTSRATSAPSLLASRSTDKDARTMTQRFLSDEIRNEADRLLGCGLMKVLAEYSEAHVVGSYALRLMTWRDLDIHTISEVGLLATSGVSPRVHQHRRLRICLR